MLSFLRRKLIPSVFRTSRWQVYGKPRREAGQRRTYLSLEALEERVTPANTINIVSGGAIGTAAALIRAQNAGAFLFTNTGTINIDPNAFVGAGAIWLRANNDVTITNAINDNNAGDSLTILAGGSINVDANVTSVNALHFTANSQLAAIGAQTAEIAVFVMSSSATINAGTAAIDITLDSGTGINTSNNILLGNLTTTGSVSVANEGPSLGGSVGEITSANSINSPNVSLDAVNGSIGLFASAINLTAANVNVNDRGTFGVFLAGTGNLALGTISNTSGAINITAVGSITVNGPVTDNDTSSNGVVALNSAVSGTTAAALNVSGIVKAQHQIYIAGDGSTGTSNVNFSGALLEGSGGITTSPTFFAYLQDASIADANVPTAAQFGNGVPLTYVIAAQQGSVTVSTFANVAGSNLILFSSAAGVTLGSGGNTALILASLNADVSSGNTITINSTAATTITTTSTVGSTTNGMIFTGAVSLSQDTTLVANGGGVDFASSSDNNLGNGNSLTVTAGGAITIGGGGFAMLQNLTVTGAAINLNGSVLANGEQTYNSPVLLGTNVALVDVTATFLGSIDSAAGATYFDLSINSTTATSFDGAGGIGQNKALNSLTTSNGAVDFSGTTIVDTVNTQSYGRAVTLDNDLALSSTSGGVSFGGTVDGGFSLTVAASSGSVTYSHAVGGGASLSQLVVTSSAIIIHGGATTVGDQIYNGAISVGVNTTFNTNTGAVLNFNGTIDGFQPGSQSIIIGNVNPAGEVIFGASIGSNVALGFVTVTATQIQINGTSVVTTGGQTYSGDVFLAAASTVTLNASSAGANVIFNGDLTLGPSATTATDTLNVTGIFTLSANSTLTSTLNTLSTSAFGNVNASTSHLADANLSLTFLGTPTVGNNYTIATNVAGTTFANVTTDGATKFYVSGVDFTAVNTLGLTLTAVSPTDAPLTVGSGGTYSTIQAAINASVSGDMIEIDSSLNNYAGFTTVNAGSQNVSLLFDFVSGGTVNINSAVTLTADTAFELSATNLTFSSSSAKIDGDFNLTVFSTTSQNLDLQGNVGSLTPLNSLTTVGANLTTQLAANVTTNTTSGGQTFYGHVQLQTNLPGKLATMTAKTVTFNGPVGDGVAGGGEDTLSVVGNAVFFGAIGSPLGALTVSGQTFLNNGGVTTGTTNGGSGTQSYSGAVFLGTASTTLSGTTLSANALGFAGTGNNTNSLTLTFTGGLTLSGGELSDVNNLSVSDTVNLTGDIVTGGTQTYNTAAGGVTLTGNTTLTTSGATYMHTVDGTTAGAQTLYINGPATFDASVGSFTTLQSLTVTQATSLDTANGSITIDTTAGQIYLQAVTIATSGSGQSVTFTDTGANIAFGQSITGDVNAPDIFFTGNDLLVVFNGVVGGGIGLFQLDGTATVVFQNGATSVTSVNDQCYSGPIDLVNISGGLFTASSSAGDVMLGAVVGGGNSLTVSGTTDNELGGDITGVANLIVNTGPIFLDTANPLTITTNGTQEYATAVILVTNVNLTGALVTFGSTIEDGSMAGTDSLTINGNAVFEDSVGDSGQSLNSFSVSGTASVNPPSGIAIGFNVTTSESFGGTLTLGANVDLFTVGAPAGATFGGPIFANGTDFITSDAATFTGVVNGVGAFDITGIANMSGGIVNSSGTQTYSAAVALGQSSGTVTVLTATGPASSIVFGGGVSVSGTSTSLSAFADDNVNFSSIVTLGTPGTLNAVADMTGLNAAGSGNGQITIAGTIQANGGNVLLAGSAFNSGPNAINAGAGNIILAPSVVATVGVGVGAQDFQIDNAQLGLLVGTNLTVGGVDASSATVNGANTTGSAIGGTFFLLSTPLAGAGSITFISAASTFNNPPTNNLGLVVSTNGAIAVNSAVTASGQVTLSAGTSLIVESGAMVQSSAATVTLDVGTANNGSNNSIAGTVEGTTVSVTGGTGNDNLLIDFTGGASLPEGLDFSGAAGTNDLTISDANGSAAHSYTITGASVVRAGAGAIDFSSVASLAVIGGNLNDTFNVTPGSTAMTLNGGSFTAGPGNTLNFNANSLGVSVSEGLYNAAGQQPVAFRNFQTINLDNAVGINGFYGPDTADRNQLTGLTAGQRFIQVMYLNALGRAGSMAELNDWLPVFNSGGNGRALVAAGIENSPEGKDHLVKQWYNHFLGRSAANGEERGWVNLLLAGASEESVLGGILGSAEFFSDAQNLVASGTPQQRYVQALYELQLNRQGSIAELNYWAGVSSMLGNVAVASKIMGSVEYRTDLITAYYNSLVHRNAAQNEINGWLGSELDQLGMRLGFDRSPEFFSNG